MSTDLAQHIDQNEEVEISVVDSDNDSKQAVDDKKVSTKNDDDTTTPNPPQKKMMEKVNSNEEEEDPMQSDPEPDPKATSNDDDDAEEEQLLQDASDDEATAPKRTNTVRCAVDPTTPSDNNTGAGFDTGSLATYFSDAFTWLDPILCYSPLWIAKPTAIAKKEASKLDYVVLSVNVALVLLYFALQYYFKITRWSFRTPIDNVIWCCYVLCICTARLLSIVYCLKYHAWPWKPEFLHFEYQKEDLNKRYMKLIVRCKMLAVVLAIFYIVVDIAVLIIQCETLVKYYGSLTAYILIKTLSRMILLYPQVFVTIIQSIVILKYCLRLHQLYDENMHSQNLSDLDVEALFESYDKLYKSFKRDYHSTLRFSLLWFFASQVLLIWDTLNFIGLLVMFVVVVREFAVFVLYFYTASVLQSIHHRFEDKLWKNGHFFLNYKAKNKGRRYYNYLLHYMQEYPIYVKVGPVVITGRNVIRFVIGLFATRGIAFTLQHWVEENY